MKKILIYSLIPLILSACGEERKSSPLKIKDEELKPFIDSFIQESNKRGKRPDFSNLTVRFDISSSEIDEETELGFCREEIIERYENFKKYKDHYKTVVISRYWFNEIDDEIKKEVIYHELGHCALGLDHNNQLGSIGGYTNVALSIMNQYNLSMYSSDYYSFIRSHWNYYLDQLFLGTNYALNNLNSVTKMSSSIRKTRVDDEGNEIIVLNERKIN